MDMTREEFDHFVRRATEVETSDERIQLYNFLVRCFTDADTDCSGTVEFEEFDRMVDLAAALPRKYGYAKTNKELYATDEHKKTARRGLFNQVDKKKTGRISLEAWVSFATGHIFEKVKLLKPHVLVNGTKEEFMAFIRKAVVKTTPEYRELYFYLLKVFQDADRDHDGAVNFEEFDRMIEIAADMPRKYGLAPKSEDTYKTPEDRMKARKAMFVRMNERPDDVISFDEWLKYAVNHISEKVCLSKSAMDMGKDEFLHFSRRAVTVKGSDEHIEMHRFLVRCFTNADTDFDGLVTFDQFDRMIDLAAAMPRKHGLAPTNEESYKNEAERIQKRRALFEKIDTEKRGFISLDTWVRYAMSHIVAKVNLQKDHVLVNGTKAEFIAFIKKAVVKTNAEHRDLYFYLLKVFQEADRDHDGAVNAVEFDRMIEVAADMPRRHGLAPKSSEMFKTDAERKTARGTQFRKMDVNNDGTISFDEWFRYAVEHIAEKIAKM